MLLENSSSSRINLPLTFGCDERKRIANKLPFVFRHKNSPRNFNGKLIREDEFFRQEVKLQICGIFFKYYKDIEKYDKREVVEIKPG